MNRNHVLKILMFVALVLLGDRTGGWLLHKGFHKTQFRFAQVMNGQLSADLVFLGNSRGVHMFHRPAIEEATGKQMANLAFNATPAVMVPVILEDYLFHHERPTQIFVEVSCVGRENEPGSLERFSVLASSSQSVMPTLYQERPRTYWFTKLSHLYRFNSELLIRSLFFLKHSDQDWIMDSVVDEQWQNSLGEAGVPQFQQNEVDASALSRTAEICESHGIDVVFILAPYLPDYARQIQNKDSWLRWLETELGHPILDYSAASIDVDGFADPIHLNANGAKQLAELLSASGDLPSLD